MSKVDAQRAMREANYARLNSGSTPKKAARAAAPVAPVTPAEGACGHKSMNGRACTREAGHSQASHRYS